MIRGPWGKLNPFRNRPMHYLRKVSFVRKEHGVCLQFITDPGLMGHKAAQGSQGHCPAQLSMGDSMSLLLLLQRVPLEWVKTRLAVLRVQLVPPSSWVPPSCLTDPVTSRIRK